MTNRLAGIDLAWKPEKNLSGVAIGRLEGRVLHVESASAELLRPEHLVRRLERVDGLAGVAIDAPLILRNLIGRRGCESELTRMYGNRGAGTHSTNLLRYPFAASVRLSRLLAERGFQHRAGPKWQIEVYPHPALIEIFGLDRRLSYKKGGVLAKATGQALLAQLIGRLAESEVLKLAFDAPTGVELEPDCVKQLRGADLKRNEDALDALVCLYIAGLHAVGEPMRVFGNDIDGYIVVPAVRCIDGGPEKLIAAAEDAAVAAVSPTPEPEPMTPSAVVIDESEPTKRQDSAVESADRLLRHLATCCNEGRPEICSYAWAYRELIGPNERWSQAYGKQVAALAQRTQSVHVTGLGAVRLDTFIVAASSRQPSNGHWATAPYGQADWVRVLGRARLRQ